MERLTDPALSLTEANRRNGVIVVVESASGSSMSNARRIPYVEQYRQSNAVVETPAQRIQRAADEEAARAQRSSD
jgi:hypothetical protein